MSASFATTRWSQVLAAGSDDAAAAHAALTWLCERQWESLRRAASRWGVPAAEVEDTVQDFCCRLIERRADLGALDPGGGRFRAWLVTVFRNFVSDRRARGAARVHGGGIHHQDVAASDIPITALDPAFDRDWAEAILHQARQRLLREGEGTTRAALAIFLDRNAEPGEYARVGDDLGLSEGAVKVAVHRLRQRYADLVRQEIAETLAYPTAQAIDDELTALVEARRNVV